MMSFGKRLAGLRKDKKMSQADVAAELETSISVISRYERDEMIPSIDTAKKLANLLDTTVGYLIGETDDGDLFRNSDMLQRLIDVNNLPEEDRIHIFYALDGLIKAAKLKAI